MRHSVIYSADFMFQVLSILTVENNKAWSIANNLQLTDKKWKNIEHFDVVTFETVGEMNQGISEQVELSIIQFKNNNYD